jgi:hypothetical protein
MSTKSKIQFYIANVLGIICATFTIFTSTHSVEACLTSSDGSTTYGKCESLSSEDKAMMDSVFDYRYYLNRYPDLRKAFGSNEYSAWKAAQHWYKYGVKEGRQGYEFFDPVFYLSNNPDVAKAYGESNYLGAIQHFVKYGKKEGRKGYR